MAMSKKARDRVAAAYDAHYDVLRFIASQKFNVPPADVRPLLHDVFLAYMRHAAAIANDRSWLVTATKNACRNYWRDRKSTEPLPDWLLDPRRLAEDVGASIDVARLLRRVSKRCRRVLWLRYVDGIEPKEIAQRCAASDSGGYGRQLVHRCLREAREVLASFRRGRA
jgi:RNA polymerase sigma factor (sigma-70 family)